MSTAYIEVTIYSLKDKAAARLMVPKQTVQKRNTLVILPIFTPTDLQLVVPHWLNTVKTNQQANVVVQTIETNHSRHTEEQRSTENGSVGEIEKKNHQDNNATVKARYSHGLDQVWYW